MEERSNTSVRLDDGKVEELTTGLDRGAGVRVARGTSYGYAFSNRLDRDALLQAAEAASAALTDEAGGTVVDLRESPARDVNHADRPGRRRAGRRRRWRWLEELNDAARSFSPEVVQVVGVYGDSLQRRLIATSDGRWVREDRPRIRLVAQVIASRGEGNIQTGFEGPAACAGVEFLDTNGPGWSRRSPRGAPSRCSTRSRPRPERCRWCSARGAAASSSTRPWAIPSRPTPSTRRRASTAGGSARPWRRRS